MTTQLLQGDCRDILKTLPDQSVQTVITSPPYYGLRDYGVIDQIGLERNPAAYVAVLVGVFREVKRVLRDDGTLWLNLGDSYSGSGKGGNPIEGKQATNRGSQSVGTLYGVGDTAREAAVTNVTRNVDGVPSKNLLGIPWRVAFALQDDGWYLRSDIIWAKPNCMPESVTDRPTRSHEYLFLFAKSERYFYDSAAIAEPVKQSSIDRINQPNFDNQTGGPKDYGTTGVNANRSMRGTLENFAKRGKGGGKNALRGQGAHNGKPANREGRDMSEVGTGLTRNKRTVWTVATRPYADAHFATFPEALVEPCILAGSLSIGAYEPDDIITTPVGEGERGNDPSIETGRAGFNRPRRDSEGVRPISRREQIAYAEQLRASPYREQMETEAGSAFAHYIRTDRSGARPVPPALLGTWLERGWLELRDIPPQVADVSRSTVLDPFAGSGTVLRVAQRLQRRAIGIELNPEYVTLQEKRTNGVQVEMVDLF